MKMPIFPQNKNQRQKYKIIFHYIQYTYLIKENQLKKSKWKLTQQFYHVFTY